MSLAMLLENDMQDMMEATCPHLSTHREEAFGKASWNPFAQDAEDPTYLVEVCDDCNEEVFSELEGDDCED